MVQGLGLRVEGTQYRQEALATRPRQALLGTDNRPWRAPASHILCNRPSNPPESRLRGSISFLGELIDSRSTFPTSPSDFSSVFLPLWAFIFRELLV